VTYDEVEIEAADEAEAEKIAEEMRVQGTLPENPAEAVEAIDFDIYPAEPPEEIIERQRRLSLPIGER
jgi:hypothetical protein